MEINLSTVWSNVLEDLKKSNAISKGYFISFLQTTALLSLENSVATIASPNTMNTSMLEKKYKPLIIEALSKHLGKTTTTLFVTQNISMQTIVEVGEEPLFRLQQAPQAAKTLQVGHLPQVRADFTFSNFAVSDTNQLAFTAAATVAEHIGTSYNPLFLYGPVGVGKTHLMHAIANEVYQKRPDGKIIYITSEEFTNEVVEAIRNNKTAEMKKRFRSAVLLLIDDIQFIEGKVAVQVEVFNTFNILINKGSQICLSSDRPPHELRRLEERLSSRFAQGLTVDIGAPDFELKSAILLKKSEKLGHPIPMDVAQLIAERAPDTRTLEGFLLRVVTQASMMNTEITLELAQKALGLMAEETRGRVHADDVIKAVCTFYDVKPTLLKGTKRNAGIVNARQVTMYLLKKQLGMTYVDIGNLLGGKDHTTIMHGVDKIETLVENKARVSEDITGIINTLHG